MKKSISPRLTFFIAAVFTALLISVLTVTAAAADASALEAIINLPDGTTETVAVSTYGGTPVICLPSFADLSSLTLRYNSGKVVVDGRQHSAGDEFTVDASSGEIVLNAWDGELRVEVMKGGNISSFFIELDGGRKSFLSVSSDKNRTASGKASVIGSDGKTVYSGGLEKFKGHGFTSFVSSPDGSYKNSYNIKLAEKAELIPGSGSIKKWVLLSPRPYDGGRDSTGLSQLFAFNTHSLLVGGSYCDVKGEFVDLYVNGEYRGVYILCERMNDGGAIDVSSLEKHVEGSESYRTVNPWDDGSDPVFDTGIQEYTYCSDAVTDGKTDITGGYVLEVMCDYYEGCGFKTENGMFFSIKSPEICTREMVAYIASYVQNFENAIYSPTGYNMDGVHYTELADAESLADMILVYAFYENFEFFRTSTYIYKNADGKLHDKLTFGPVWDFETPADMLGDDSFFGTGNGFTYFVHQQYVWSEMLWQHGDFMAVMARENEKLVSAVDGAADRIRSAVDSSAASHEMDVRRWGTQPYKNRASAYLKAVSHRRETWFMDLWSVDNLLSVSVTVSDSGSGDGNVTLTADIGGDGGDIRWYVLDGGTLYDFSAYNKGEKSITVPADGKLYFCSATGKNNAYLRDAAGSVFSSPEVTMNSAPTAAAAVPPPQVIETIPVTMEPTDAETENGCGSAAPSPLVFAALLPAAFALTVKKKKSKS